ncbi:MAG TPA: DUF5668 domain-containing protein [Thermoanaerobaculia bacterium]|nr:DUF5668 domain-containing protein [Thermoanaerobaculia bacterium]
MSTATEHPWPHDVEAPSPASSAPAAPPVYYAERPDLITRKRPRLAAALAVFPGVGHIYNGLYMRGMTFFLVFMSLILLASEQEAFGFAVGFFWIFNVIDTYRQAVLINYGYAQDLGMVDLPAHPRAAQGGLFAGVLLTTVGLFAFFERFFDIRLDWLLDLWPLALVAIGAWLIVGSLRDRKNRADLGNL